MRISFITTVYNEEKTIDKFLHSLENQSKLPDEIIIVDGGSTDNTLSEISKFKSPISNKKIRILQKRGNRSVGRNTAIKKAGGKIIVCSDAGNILDKNWIKNITKPFHDKSVDVVAGYYKGLAKNIFQKCLIPYVLTMSDKVNYEKFLPATRSMAFTKKVWEKVGGFDETLSHNEDYAFARKLKNTKAKIVFAKTAIVNWIPRDSLKKAFTMFFRFAYGDAESGILRPKVVLLFARYILGLFLFSLALYFKSNLILNVCCALLLTYLIWSITKNYKYVKSLHAMYLLPILQLCSDIAVIAGTASGALKRLQNIFLANKAVSAIISIYILLLLSVVHWGIPNQDHPYLYHMDEWHQFMSVKSVIQHGTPNIEGAAHGPIFQFLLSGIYLAPFVLIGVISPELLKDNLMMQNTLFIILRINTLLFGVFSLILIAKISKNFLKVPPLLSVAFFAATPIWISLSNYFKYDIALIFWVLLSFLFIIKFHKKQTVKNFVLAGIFGALALSTKISVLPLIPIYIFSFFFFSRIKKYKTLFLGVISFIITFLIFGIPDVILGQANYGNFFSSNLQDVPKESTNILLTKSYWIYLFWDQYLLIFGHLFYILALISIAYWIIYYIINTNKIFQDKLPFFFLVSLGIFTLSLAPLKLFATGNRSLVLLPFLCFLTLLFLKRIYKTISGKKRQLFTIIISLIITFQVIETFSWIYIKYLPDPRDNSSQWIINNLPNSSSIGVEEIPIYQYLPDIIVKELYIRNNDNNYSYIVFTNKLVIFPDYVITTNYEILNKYFIISPSKQITNDLKNNNYKVVADFYPNPLPKIINDPLGFYLSNIVPMRSVIIYKRGG